MDLALALGIAGLALTVGFGIGAWRQGRQSHTEVSSQLAEIGHRIVLMSPGVAATAGRVDFVAVDYADVNNDGRKELLVQHWAGNHGTALRVMGYTDEHLPDFDQIAVLTTGTTEGFTVGDLDGDGRIEVATVDEDYGREIAPGRTASHADGARIELLYRWDGHEFAKIGSRALPLPEEAARPEPIWHTNPLPLLASAE